MKQVVTILFISTLFFMSCGEAKKTTQEKQTPKAPLAMLIDGEWEANYIMNTPKPMDSLYSRNKPTMVFNSSEAKVMGNTGCNNFNGTVNIDGGSLLFSDNMALTRKMCPDMSGETIFLETLKKVNGYSVTEQGKTLNLIMGDIAIMRLQRR